MNSKTNKQFERAITSFIKNHHDYKIKHLKITYILVREEMQKLKIQYEYKYTNPKFPNVEFGEISINFKEFNYGS